MSQILDHLYEVGPGWHIILAKLHYDLLKIDPTYEVGQVKEKWGELRVYLRGYSPGTIELVEAASSASTVTCEMCGEPGVTQEGGWVKTLCPEHQTQRVLDRAKLNWG